MSSRQSGVVGFGVLGSMILGAEFDFFGDVAAISLGSTLTVDQPDSTVEPRYRSSQLKVENKLG